MQTKYVFNNRLKTSINNIPLDEDDMPMTQTRRRICYDAQNNEAMGCESKGQAEEERICGDAICPQVPEWANWGPWESCSSACKEDGEGEQLRRRLCLEDRRSGLTCSSNPPEGPNIQRQKCVVETTCGAGVGFNVWSKWSDCDLECAPRDGSSTGVQLRTRVCTGSSSSCSSLAWF